MTNEELVAEALRVDVYDGDGWLSDAQGANLHVGSGGEVYFAGDGSIDVQHAAGLAVAALRAANMLREPAVPDAATEAKQPEGWSTEDRQESKQEAERRWVDERSGYKSDYNRGCINGFILGAEWQKARETFISFMSIADEARAERDAALAAIERVRAVHEFDDGYCKSCEIPFHECDIATALEAALDGAPEPEEKL